MIESVKGIAIETVFLRKADIRHLEEDGFVEIQTKVGELRIAKYPLDEDDSE